jgi:hypothetical protein
MKQYIIAKALTGSEWDDVDFALIEMHDGHAKYIHQVSDHASDLKKKLEDESARITISADNAQFFVADDIIRALLPDEIDVEDSDDFAAIISLDENVVEKLTRPQNDIRYGHIVFDGNTVKYSGYGKHTGEEYWTADIDINLIPYKYGVQPQKQTPSK